VERESGRPVVVTEWYAKGMDSGMANTTGAGWLVRTQADRGWFYQNFVLALMESKVCVGWHWFKYATTIPPIRRPTVEPRREQGHRQRRLCPVARAAHGDEGAERSRVSPR